MTRLSDVSQVALHKSKPETSVTLFSFRGMPWYRLIKTILLFDYPSIIFLDDFLYIYINLLELEHGNQGKNSYRKKFSENRITRSKKEYLSCKCSRKAKAMMVER